MTQIRMPSSLVTWRACSKSLALLSLLLLPLLRLAQAGDNPDQRFLPVWRAFQDGMFGYAEKEFGKLIREFPQWPRLPEAMLYQARARFALRQFDGALDLLKSHQTQAGALADRFQYWIAKTEFERGDYSAAATDFQLLLKNYSHSPLRLEAAYGQAYALFKAGNIAGTISLLKDSSGAFQKSAAGSTNSAVISEGYLLLGQAFRAQGDYRGAEETLQQLGSRNPGAELEWKRQYLLARVELANRRPADALIRATNLVASVASRNIPVLKAQALGLQAEVLLELNRPEAAGQVYEQIIQLKNLDAEEHRKALLKLVELATTRNQIEAAVRRLENYIAQNSQDVSLDLLRLTLGELNLRQYNASLANGATRQPATNGLLRAENEFNFVIRTFTNSSYLGKAYLNLGWCSWAEANATDAPAKYAEGLASFRAAAAKLPRSEDQATARIKWADCAFQIKDYPTALTNYQAIIEEYGSFPTVREKFFEPVLYQIVRASIELRQLAPAQSAIDKLLAWFPHGEQTDNSLLLYGQALADQGKIKEGRQALELMIRQFPKSSLLPDARLALAQSYVKERKWPQAIKTFDDWVRDYSQNPARPRVEFDRAWAHYQAGHETNAFLLFTNFVSHYTNDPLWPTAKMWVAGHFYRQNDFAIAELNYQPLFHLPTNNPSASFIYEAQLMSGYSAFYRQNYREARGYLTNLLNLTSCPRSIMPEALFLLGNTYTEDRPSDPTNSISNFQEALRPFRAIVDYFPTNRLVPLAWGRIGDCKLQLAAQDPKQYIDATNAYQQVLDSPLADVSARSQAEVGLGMVLEKMAPLRPAAEATQLMEDALHHYFNVVYGKLRLAPGEHLEPYWVGKAGLSAGRLAEALQHHDQAAKIYQRMRSLVPVMDPIWEKKLELLEKVDESKRASSGP